MCDVPFLFSLKAQHCVLRKKVNAAIDEYQYINVTSTKIFPMKRLLFSRKKFNNNNCLMACSHCVYS